MEKGKAKIIGAKREGGAIKATYELGRGMTIDSPLLHSKASVFQRFHPGNSPRYNSNITPMYDIEPIPDSFSEQVALARKYYNEEPITGTVIDVLTQFSISEIEHITEDEETKKFFDALYEESSNLREAIKWAYLEYYVACNVFPVRSEKGENITTRDGISVPEYRWTVLNPEEVEIVGSLLFDQASITLRPSKELRELALSTDPATRKIMQSMPADIKQASISGNNLVMDPDKVYHIARNKQPFEKYAVPFIMRNVGPLRVKQKLMEMDLSTADGVINQLITVTIGNDEHPASQEDLEALGELLNTPNKAYALLWNHTLKVQFHKPEANFFDAKKYEQVNRDIAAGFGIARSIIGEGGTYASQTVAVQSLIQWLEWGREDIKKWIEREYRIIAQENGLKTWPRVRFKKVSLSEERLIKNVLMGLYDRGVISAETLAKETGHDINVEMGRQRKEKSLIEEGLLSPKSPYQQRGRPEGTGETLERDIRDSNPEPHGASASVRDSPDLDKVSKSYVEQFSAAYKRARQRILEGINSSEDRDTHDDIIDAAILSLLTDINRAGDRHMTVTFDLVYREHTGEDYRLDVEASSYLDKALSWNSIYTQKLSGDILRRIKDNPDIKNNPHVVINNAFDTQEYRVNLFGRESIKKAEFYAELVSMKKHGYVSGRWSASFRNTCSICLDRHGETYSFEELEEIYPAHNNCECAIEWVT